ncbi:hypothetical protein FO519_000176 [Halicephalobus sp. NKZ332]|nr:hypothetical protein FO519_000176 [Halicephalobus sp. NKZ332]
MSTGTVSQAVHQEALDELCHLKAELENAKKEKDQMAGELEVLRALKGDPRLSETNYDASLISQFSRMELRPSTTIPNPVVRITNTLTDAERAAYQARIDELERKLNAEQVDNQKRNKMISGLQKMLNIDSTYIEAENDEGDCREVWLKRLHADLKAIDRNWHQYSPNLVKALRDFIDGSGFDNPSIAVEMLAAEREELGKELDALRAFDTGSFNAPTKDISLSFHPDASVAINVLANQSYAPAELDMFKSGFIMYRNVCSKMFEKLKMTADFLQILLEILETSTDDSVKQLVEKIRALQMALNSSIDEASILLENAARVEESINTALEESMRPSLAPFNGKEASFALEERVKVVVDDAKIKELEARIEELQSIETAEKQRINELQLELESAKDLVDSGNEAKEHVSLIEKQLSDAKGRIAELENQLTEANEALNHTYEKLKNAEQRLGELAKAEKENLSMKKALNAAAPAIIEEVEKIHDVLSSASEDFKKIQKIEAALKRVAAEKARKRSEK